MKTDIYAACDRAITEMDRIILDTFGRLKLAKWDRINIIRTVSEAYETTAKKARRRYFEVAFEAYVIGLMLCGVESKKAHQMAEKAITSAWVKDVLEQTDFVTLYRFDTETERKAQRLAETISAILERKNPMREPATGVELEIEKAMRIWSKQIGQYAVNMTDYAMLQAYEDAGIDGVIWVAEHDERTCNECALMDGRWYPLEDVPAKPHWGCRCRLMPSKKKVSTD